MRGVPRGMTDGPTRDLDAEVRLAAFEWLARCVGEYGDVLLRTTLASGFEFRGQRVPMLGPQGIFKPRILKEVPISITTSPSGPYDDSFGPDGLLLYRYRGTDPQHHENVGLRKALLRRTPLVYFHGVVPGRYLAVWPVFVVEDMPNELGFKVAVDDMAYVTEEWARMGSDELIRDPDAGARRVYITASVRRRLHQRGFRERVLAAYSEQCALCRLRHRELLDAAHIVPDSEPGGEPVVRNGIAFCKLHHAAFDNFFLGIRPDYRVIVREDVLREKDGPMLLHGLQGLHNTFLAIPKRSVLRPDPELLARRWERFEKVA